VEENHEEENIFLILNGRVSMPEKKAYNLSLPKKLGEAVDAHSIGSRNAVLAILIAKGLEAFEKETNIKKKPITINPEDFLKNLDYLP